MERRSITVRGIVQGVGFRPFVHGLASGLQLGGFVQNRTDGVRIEVEGDGRRLDDFLARIVSQAPGPARIDEVRWDAQPVRGETGFRIVPSEDAGAGGVVIAPDMATCAACLAELFDATDRRYRYAFLNCTNCGPRLTIVTGAPYDRRNTTMGKFTMCAACRAEYADPTNRRFHAEPIACPECGPRLEALDAAGRAIAQADALGMCAEAVRGGRIVALKGLGGYHLACDARNAGAVAELRRRKHREEKPLAVLVRDAEAAGMLCAVSDVERVVLASRHAPIVLLRKGAGYDLAEGVAPGNPSLGVMLPYTPLHHLLVREAGCGALVMTSGNRSDEPIAYRDEDAAKRLAGVADLFIVHDRQIHVRCDDSVTRVIAGEESPVRRSRGYAPAPLQLPFACPGPILGVGGQNRVALAIGRERSAIVGHHAGDLDNFEAYRQYERDVGLYEGLFAVRPEVIAHDLHPDYASTRYALRRGAAEGIGLVGVQHHHAHMASCMAENGLSGRVIGVTFDGTGFGEDGRVWGGEFLVGGYEEFRRGARLRYVVMPGGERAIREPWRMALAHLVDAGAPIEGVAGRAPAEASRVVLRMIERRLNAPETSSAGRLFDAAASLAGVRDVAAYEGQAAMELEWLATTAKASGSYPFEIVGDGGMDADSLEVDTRPLVRAIGADVRRGEPAAGVARRFHTTMVDIIVAVCGRLRGVWGLDRVVLTGGVFANALLSVETCERLRDAGFGVFRHRLVPPGDAGLSLGQIAVAAARRGRGPGT